MRPSKIPALTHRQNALYDRLVKLGEWATDERLPCKVKEIVGFGSFFRGKPSPKDVDLILRIDNPELTPRFNHFCEVLKAIRDSRRNQAKFGTPREALHVELRRLAQSERLVSDAAAYRESLYSSWLEGYSWPMLFPATIIGQCSLKSPEEFTRRLLRREFPNLNVIRYERFKDKWDGFGELRCGFSVSLWSEGRPDIRSNLARLLSDDVVTENALRDMAYFQVQLPNISAEVQLVTAEIALLRRIPWRKKSAPKNLSDESLVANDPEMITLKAHSEKTKKAADAFDKLKISGEFIPSGDMAPSNAISEADRLRKEIKEQYVRFDILEQIRNVLNWYHAQELDTPLNHLDYVADELLKSGNVQERKRKRQILEELGWKDRGAFRDD